MKPIVSFLKHTMPSEQLWQDYDVLHSEVLLLDTSLPVEDKITAIIKTHPVRSLQVLLATYFTLILLLRAFISRRAAGLGSQGMQWLGGRLDLHLFLSAFATAAIDIVANFNKPNFAELVDNIKQKGDVAVEAGGEDKPATASSEVDEDTAKLQYFKQLLDDLRHMIRSKSSLLMFFSLLGLWVLKRPDPSLIFVLALSLLPHVFYSAHVWLSLLCPEQTLTSLKQIGLLEEDKDTHTLKMRRSIVNVVDSISEVGSLVVELPMLVTALLGILQLPTASTAAAGSRQRGKTSNSVLTQLIKAILLQNYLFLRLVSAYNNLPSLSSQWQSSESTKGIISSVQAFIDSAVSSLQSGVTGVSTTKGSSKKKKSVGTKKKSTKTRAGNKQTLSKKGKDKDKEEKEQKVEKEEERTTSGDNSSEEGAQSEMDVTDAEDSSEDNTEETSDAQEKGSSDEKEHEFSESHDEA